jgi:hypothetical protein
MNKPMITARRRARRAEKQGVAVEKEVVVTLGPESVDVRAEEKKVSALTVAAVLYNMGDEDLANAIVNRYGVENEYKEMLRRMNNGK